MREVRRRTVHREQAWVRLISGGWGSLTPD